MFWIFAIIQAIAVYYMVVFWGTGTEEVFWFVLFSLSISTFGIEYLLYSKN